MSRSELLASAAHSTELLAAVADIPHDAELAFIGCGLRLSLAPQRPLAAAPGRAVAQAPRCLPRSQGPIWQNRLHLPLSTPRWCFARTREHSNAHWLFGGLALSQPTPLPALPHSRQSGGAGTELMGKLGNRGMLHSCVRGIRRWCFAPPRSPRGGSGRASRRGASPRRSSPPSPLHFIWSCG